MNPSRQHRRSAICLFTTKIKICHLILILISFSSYGQFKLTGVVNDSLTHEPLPGVNVQIKNIDAGAVTNSNGEFEIESNTPSALVTFSFVGLKTKTQTISSGTKAIIELPVDETSEDTNHFYKASLDVGYFGDREYAPFGFIVNHSMQSIGRISLNVNSNFRYWRAGNNSGLQYSISKDLSGKINYLADNLFLDFKSIAYTDNGLNLKQARGLIANELPGFFAFDIGGGYNLLSGGEEGFINVKYFSGIIGVTKIFSYSSIFKNWAIYANLNYHPAHAMFEIGTYKGIYIRNLPAMVLMAKYYDYEIDHGLLLSIRFKIFNTRYYCCHSWKVYYDDLNALK
jgi:hypothetical protein